MLLNGYRYLKGHVMDLFADQLRAEILDPSPPDCYSVLCDNVDDLFDHLRKVIQIRNRNMHSWHGRIIRRILSLLGWSWINHNEYVDNRNTGNLTEALERDHLMQERITRDYITSTEQQNSGHLATLSFIIREMTDTSESALPNSSNAEGDHISENVEIAPRSEILQRERLGRHSTGILLYRRTDLSEAPSASLVPLISENLTSFLLLPAKAAILKYIIQMFINFPLIGNVNGLSRVCLQPLPPFRGILLKSFKHMKLTDFVINLERFALVSVLKLVTDLGWWTCEWAAVIWTGKRFFNWGSL